MSDRILGTLDNSKGKECVKCIKGKMTNKKRIRAERAKDVLELIHADRSDRGDEYYGRYDGSGEQRPGPFAQFFKECGIVPQYTMPGSPSMNGVAERRNRTLKDMVRSMIARTTLPKSLWGMPLRPQFIFSTEHPQKQRTKPHMSFG